MVASSVILWDLPMTKNSGKQPKIEKRGDVRVIFGPETMKKLRAVSQRDKRAIYQQVAFYVERALDAEKAA